MDTGGETSTHLQKWSTINVWPARSTVLEKLFLPPEATDLHPLGLLSPLVIVCVCFPDGVKPSPAQQADALTVAKELIKNVFPTQGMPFTVSYALGTHFTRQIT